LAVTVRAEEQEVFEAVVVSVAVDVVERDPNRLSSPLGETALLAPFLLQACLEKPCLEVSSVASPAVGEQLLDGDQCASGPELFGANSVVPGG
jgi:hypothetical protein